MIHSLGKVTTTAGTPKLITSNNSDPSARVPCHSIMVQALASNVGKVYVGAVGMNKSTGDGVWAVLAIPTINSIPAFTSTISYAPGGLIANAYYIDVDNSGEGVISSYIAG